MLINKSILLVEDDLSLASRLRCALKDNLDCTVTVVSKLSEAKKQLRRYIYHLVIVDRGLPDGDGLSLLKLADITLDSQFLILTSRNRLSEREAGMMAGAVDYIGKPFSTLELIIKVKRLLKLGQHRLSDLIRIEQNFSFAPQVRQVTIDGRVRHLTAAETRFLELLVRNHGFLVSIATLKHQVWRDADVSPGAICAQVYRLRLKLGRFSKLVTNCHNFGYLFNSTTNPRVATKAA